MPGLRLWSYDSWAEDGGHGRGRDQVWPWLVQLGWDRGGWYSWDRLDNADRPSARDVDPEWQDLAVGDQLK